MSTAAPVHLPRTTSPHFAPNHPWDRNFQLALLVIAWTGNLLGFGASISHHLAENRPPYPLIVHMHGVVFTGWLVLYTVQVLLVHWRKLKVHRQLGMVMAGVAVVMLFLGPATALHVKHLKMNQARTDPAFLSIQRRPAGIWGAHRRRPDAPQGPGHPSAADAARHALPHRCRLRTLDW
jgi:hypothetical protein